jgi:hypothetical protein
MSEAQSPCVEHLAREIARAFPRISPVAQHGVADVKKVHPHLVSAPAVNPAFDKAGVGRLRGYLIFRLRGATTRFRGRHPRAIHRMTRDRCLDEAVLVAKLAGDQSEINFINSATGKLRGETAMRLIVFRDDEASAGFLVETVNNSRPRFTADT